MEAVSAIADFDRLTGSSIWVELSGVVEVGGEGVSRSKGRRGIGRRRGRSVVEDIV